MDNILRNHRELDRNAGRNMKLARLADSICMLDVPHPLLPDHEDLDRVLGRSAIVYIELCAPDKNQEGKKHRRHRPENLYSQILVGRADSACLGTLAITNREIDDGDEDNDRKEDGQCRDRVE